MEKRSKKRKMVLRLWQRLAIAFCAIIFLIMSGVIALYVRTMRAMREAIYGRMEASAEYYQQTFENDLQNILDQQIGFFADRKLPFLAGPRISLNTYEKREALLSAKERLQSAVEISDLLDSGILYIPQSGYCITENRIRSMTEDDREKMQTYLQKEGGCLQFDGTRYFAVRTGESRITFSSNPKFVFVLFFSNEQVRKRLEVLKPSEGDGGSFLYNEAENVTIENESALVGMADIIINHMKQNEDGSWPETQQIHINGNNYLVLTGSEGDMGTFIQYIREREVTAFISQSWKIMVVFLIGMVVAAVLFVCYVQRLVHRPLAVLMNAFANVKKGDFEHHIYRDKEDEFNYLYQGFNEMEDQLKQLIEEVYVQKNLAQRAQLKQLQAQINPHFLYNSFFILSRRIKRGDIEGSEEFAKHLGNYFKYLTRDAADDVPLQREVEHATSYAAIQGARFAGRIRVEFGELPKEAAGILVPRLILQPILENAFRYGLENKTEQGLLRIDFRQTEEVLEIVVEDNGEEATDECIEKMKNSLKEDSGAEVTGLINIHRRLQIYFGSEYGIYVERSQIGGVAIKMRIPQVVKMQIKQ